MGPEWAALERFSFGDSEALADELIALVLSGTKTATCWSAREDGPSIVGSRAVACDGAGRPRAVLQTSAIEQCGFSDVTADFAYSEGEGDRSLAWWRAEHQRFFEQNGGFDPEMALWCERFVVVARL